MTIIDTVNPNSCYNLGGHFLFYFMITVQICLFVDISPLQKHPTCKLNYLIASVLAAAIPSAITSFATFSSATMELSIGIGSALALSVLTTLTIQQIIDVDIDF
ncbi:MAG: hypothetical protein JKY93_00270 [Gammaproteobacteria bacterium]|nr:hypothetical protein [Gammaproteobacteria bacterium]